MANVLVDESSLQGIANAIRSKNGTLNTYTPAQMEQAIRDISIRHNLTHGIISDCYIPARERVFNGYTPISATINRPDTSLMDNPCYILEANINNPVYDNSWSCLISFGGNSATNGGCIFVNSHQFIPYAGNARRTGYNFQDQSGNGYYHIAVVMSNNKTCVYLNKSLVSTINENYLYANCLTVCSDNIEIGRNQSNTGETLKGFLNKISLTVKDIPNEDALSASDFELSVPSDL